MSFIDYNFFPILFFLGWNILTTKQFRPNVYNTSDPKTSCALSVFSLTNSMSKETLQVNPKPEKGSNILRFVPRFRFLSDYQKSIGALPTEPLSVGPAGIQKSRISTVYMKEADNITYVVKPKQRLNLTLTNGDKKWYFTNHNLVNNRWNHHLKSNLFDFTYRSKGKTFLCSFFPYNYKVKPVFPAKIESSLNLTDSTAKEENSNLFSGSKGFTETLFSSRKDKMCEAMGWDPIDNQFLNGNRYAYVSHNVRDKDLTSLFSSRLKDGIFFGGLCSSQNDSSFWKKAQKRLGYNWLDRKIVHPQVSVLLNLFPFKSQTKNAFVLKKNASKHQYSSTETKKAMKRNYKFQDSSFSILAVNTRKFNNINFIQKRRLKNRFLLRMPIQKIYSLNRFQIALCFSKILQPPILFNDNYRFNLAFPFSNKFKNTDASVFKTSLNTDASSVYNSRFINVENELKPPTRFLGAERPSLALTDTQTSQFPERESASMVKAKALKTDPSVFLNTFENTEAQSLDNTFTKPGQETSYIDNYKMRKNRSYMKTQFFQHLAWNMKHKISDSFSNLEYLVHTIGLPVNRSDNFVTRPSTITSYQDKQHFSTNGDSSIKLANQDLKTVPFVNETKSHNMSINHENTKSILLNDPSVEHKKDSLVKTPKFSQALNVSLQAKQWGGTQNYLLKIYGGSWYYENLSFPYNIFSTLPIIPLSPLESKPMSGSTHRFTPSKVMSWHSILSHWREIFFKQKDVTEKAKSFRSKRLAIIWFYARQYNRLTNFRYWPYKNKLEYHHREMLGSSSGSKRFTETLLSSREDKMCEAMEWHPTKSQAFLTSFVKTPFNKRRVRVFDIFDVKNTDADDRSINVGSFSMNQQFLNDHREKEPFRSKLSELAEDRNGSFLAEKKQMNSLAIFDSLDRNGFFSPFLFIPLFDESKSGEKQESAFWNKNETQFIKDQFKLNPMTLSNPHFNNSHSYKKDPFFAKMQTKFESDIGIYSLAHKLSSIGFRNGNSEIDIYPFKYNDSYRYNFQNMNLSNQHLQSMVTAQDFVSGQKTNLSNVRTFLDFQNPTFSKIYAPVFQPQGLNLLSFIYNSPLQIVPTNSIVSTQSIAFFNSSQETKKTPGHRLMNFFLPNQIQPTINDHPHYLKRTQKIDRPSKTMPISNQTKGLKTFNALHHKLPINGIHTNPYPWITQNASDRWSGSHFLFSSLSNPSFLESFSETEPQYLKANADNREEKWLKKETTVTTNRLNNRQKESLKRSNLHRHFTEKPSCIKKPSIFFSSFRHLPYFFTSETLSKKSVVFPQANLSLPPLFGFPNHQALNISLQAKQWGETQLSRLNKNVDNSSDLFPPQYFLFHNNISKQNQKKEVIEPWKSYLQQKSFSLKPLSIFLKKEVGYHTSLFSKKTPKIWPENKRKSIAKTNLGIPSSLRLEKSDRPSLTPIQKNTWKVFPPLFQPLTFRFIDLNLPRTCSSELLTNSTLNKSSNHYEKTEVGKKPFSRLAKTKKWNMTQKDFFRFPIPFYISDFFRFSADGSSHRNIKSSLPMNNHQNNENTGFSESAFPLTDFFRVDEYKQQWNNNQRFEKNDGKLLLDETPKFQNSKIIVYGEKPLLKRRTAHGPPLKNQKESISLPSYLKNITNQNYQNLCPNNLNELYFVFWILFNKTLFIYLSLHYLRKFISFLGTEYIRNLFKIFVTMKFIDGNVLSIIKTFQDFNFQLNQQNVIDIKVNKQLKHIKRN